jgi:isopentenyl diphosphate isomerase/L-lactate dehydrogenase-like FMN-dependent dehydrogenase
MTEHGSGTSDDIRPIAAPLNVREYEAAARERLPQMAYDYYAGAADDEVTLDLNRAVYERILLRPRVLVDVSRIDTSLELLGHRLRFPILLAPTAFQRLAHPDGELATARAARAAGTLFMMAGTLSTTSVEDTAAAVGGPFWLQVYVFRDRGLTQHLVERARAAGCSALCLTVTFPVAGNRERDAHNGFALPQGLDMANFRGLEQARFPGTHGSGLAAFVAHQFDPSLTWEAVEWLREMSGLPVLVKGVVTAEDARLAADHGAAGIIVSNHGGRQLDTAEPTLRALPRVIEGVEDRLPVLVDGGIRRGTDVLKALALGARATLIGRPYLWGLATGGQAGVERVIALLRAELERAMALTGCPTLGDVSRALLTGEVPE